MKLAVSKRKEDEEACNEMYTEDTSTLNSRINDDEEIVTDDTGSDEEGLGESSKCHSAASNSPSGGVQYAHINVLNNSSNSSINSKGQSHAKKPRLVFTDIQRRTLQAIFKETKRPSKEMQMTIAQQLGLEVTTVSNFFMNARRRSMDKWKDQEDDSNSSSAK
jgi:hypothetical protein